MKLWGTWCGLSSQQYEFDIYSIGESLPKWGGVFILCKEHDGHWDQLAIGACANFAKVLAEHSETTHIHIHLCLDENKQASILSDLQQNHMLWNKSVIQRSSLALVVDNSSQSEHEPSAHSPIKSLNAHAMYCSASY